MEANDIMAHPHMAGGVGEGRAGPDHGNADMTHFHSQVALRRVMQDMITTMQR